MSGRALERPGTTAGAPRSALLRRPGTQPGDPGLGSLPRAGRSRGARRARRQGAR